nr:TetR family transcriptional regulator [Cytophagales bacterium]
MKIEKAKRRYKMQARAKKVSENEERILKSIFEHWKKLSIHEITLEMVAADSGVTVRTILRKYGSKEGLIEACVEKDISNIKKVRNTAATGDYSQALEILLNDYERIGDAAVRTLAIELELPIAKKILDNGRAYHREWCKIVFGPFLPDQNSSDYEPQLLSFITATEFYLWKLLRRDLNKSPETTFLVFKSLVEGLIHQRKESTPLL